MKVPISLALVLLAVLTGCVTGKPYIPVQGPGLATVRLINESQGVVSASESLRGDCSDLEWLGGYWERDRQHIQPGQSVATKARPGKLFALTAERYISSFPVRSCNAAAGLIPEEDAVYEVSYQTDADNRCWLRGRKLTPQGWVPEPLIPLDFYISIRPWVRPTTCPRRKYG